MLNLWATNQIRFAPHQNIL